MCLGFVSQSIVSLNCFSLFFACSRRVSLCSLSLFLFLFLFFLTQRLSFFLLFLLSLCHTDMYDTYNALVRDARDIFMIDSLNTVEELREMHTRILCDDEEMKATNLKLVERLVRARRTRKELEDHLEAAVFDLMHTSVDEMLAVSSSDEEEEEEKEELEVVSEEGTEEKGEELPQATQGKSQDELRMERIVKRESRVMLVAERDKQRTVEEVKKKRCETLY